MSKFFLEDGFSEHPSIVKADREIQRIVSGLCEELKAEGITRNELRILESWFTGAIHLSLAEIGIKMMIERRKSDMAAENKWAKRLAERSKK